MEAALIVFAFVALFTAAALGASTGLIVAAFFAPLALGMLLSDGFGA